MPLFTAETARAAALLSHAPTSARHLPAIPPPSPAIPAELAAVPAETADSFANRRLSRVRTQLDGLDALIADETDPKRLKMLCDASARLSTQEFALAGRPLPGSRRPSSERASRATIELRPLLADAAPVQVAPAAPVRRPYLGEYEDPPGLVREPPAAPPNGPAA